MSLPALQAFCKIVELSSFREAAQVLGAPVGTVSAQIRALESRLGARLLLRTSRHVEPTAAGWTYYRRISALIEGLHEAEQLLKDSDTQPQGRLHVSLPASVARLVVAPELPQFLQKFPHISLRMVATDHVVDLAAQGVDCAVRAGGLLGGVEPGHPCVRLPQFFAASPALVARHGEPATLEELAAYPFISYAADSDKLRLRLDVRCGREQRCLEAAAPLSVDDGSAYVALACAGLGVIHSPLYDLQPEVSAGRLQILMPQWRADDLLFHVIYARGRQNLPRVMAFVSWMLDRLQQARWQRP